MIYIRKRKEPLYPLYDKSMSIFKGGSWKGNGILYDGKTSIFYWSVLDIFVGNIFLLDFVLRIPM